MHIFTFTLTLLRSLLVVGIIFVLSGCNPHVIDPIALTNANGNETYEQALGKWYNGAWPNDHGVEYHFEQDKINYLYLGGSLIAPREEYQIKKISFDEKKNKFIGEVIGKSSNRRYVAIFIRDVLEGGRISLIKYGSKPNPVLFLSAFLTKKEAEEKQAPAFESGAWSQYSAAKK